MIIMNLDRVSVTYVSQPIFEDLSWEIHSDRCVGLVGPNGCGKSTLMRLIAGQLTSDTGYFVRQPQHQRGLSAPGAASDARAHGLGRGVDCLERTACR